MNSATFVENFSRGTLKDGQSSASLSHEIHEDGTRILINYGTPIAFILFDGTAAVTDEKYSVTTSKHVNRVRSCFEWTARVQMTAKEIDQAYGVHLYGRMGKPCPRR